MSDGTGNISYGRDVDDMTDRERIEEIAGVLARGVLRLSAGSATGNHTLGTSPESSRNGLALSAVPCPDGVRVNNSENSR